VAAIGHHQFVKLDVHLPVRRKIRIHGGDGALHLRNPVDARDFTRNFSTRRHNDLVEAINRLNNFPMNRLPNLLDADFLIQSHFQRSTRWRRQRNGTGQFRQSWRW